MRGKLVVFLALLSAGNAFADGIPHMPNELVYNLRAMRAPSRPWVVTSSGLTATVRVTKRFTGSSDWARWRLAIDISHKKPAWKLISATTPTEGVALNEIVANNNKTWRITANVIAPMLCSSLKNREPVILVLVYILEGKRSHKQVEVDHRCLLGDLIDERDAYSYSGIARKYLKDPLIETLVSRSEFQPLLSLTEELERLRRWLGFGKWSLQEDPPFILPGWGGVGYILSPSEVARLGGDCKSWTVFLAAYLTRRGWNTAVAFAPGHVWVQVYTPVTIDIDWVAEPAPEGPTSVAIVVK